MRVLVGCEYSGRVRDALIKKGHDAISCDIIETESPGPHIICDITQIDFRWFDMAIVFPPCTYMCVSGNRHYAAGKPLHFLRKMALIWTEKLWQKITLHCGKVSFENPVGVLSTHTLLYPSLSISSLTCSGILKLKKLLFIFTGCLS